MTHEWNAAANHQIPPGLWAELAAQRDKFESKRPMMPYTEEDVMNELRSITDKHEQPYVPTEVLQYLDQGQQPIDKAFSVLKNLAPDEYYDLVESGHITPEMQSQMYSEAAHGPTSQMYSEAAHGSSKPHQPFPESQPMPYSKEVQQLLLQMAQEKLANPTYLQNMMEILNKPEGMDFARAAKREYENSMNPQANVDEDTY